MGWNPFDKAKDAVRKIINPAVDKARRTLDDLAKSLARRLERQGEAIEGEIKGFARKAEDKLEDTRDATIAQVQGAGKEIEEGLTERVPELVTENLPEILEDAGQAAFAAAMGPFGDAAVALIKCGANGSDAFQIGPVTVTVDNAGDKLDAIRHYMVNPPDWKDRSDVLKFAETVSFSSITVGATVKGVALVVTSNALEVGYFKTWQTEQFLADLDEVIDTFKRIL